MLTAQCRLWQTASVDRIDFTLYVLHHAPTSTTGTAAMHQPDTRCSKQRNATAERSQDRSSVHSRTQESSLKGRLPQMRTNEMNASRVEEYNELYNEEARHSHSATALVSRHTRHSGRVHYTTPEAEADNREQGRRHNTDAHTLTNQLTNRHPASVNWPLAYTESTCLTYFSLCSRLVDEPLDESKPAVHFHCTSMPSREAPTTAAHSP